MIKYEALVNNYYYNNEDIDKVIKLLKDTNYYESCTRENVSVLVESVNKFLNDIKIKREKTVLERHETEEEARAYFGEDFIDKFDKLLTELDKQQTIVALHGTYPDKCPKICEEGLKYLYPSISSTAVSQSMAYGAGEMHYDKYEELLNWRHRNYKGLIMIAIPYECYYKEGLWNHYQETGYVMYGAQDYKINPDFIACYDYTGLVEDTSIYRENKELDNDKVSRIMRENLKKFKSSGVSTVERKGKREEKIDIKKIPEYIEHLNYTFNSIKLGYPDVMSEERYKELLSDLSNDFATVTKALPLLETEKELRKSKEVVSVPISTIQNTDDFVFDDDIEWNDTSLTQEEGKKL